MYTYVSHERAQSSSDWLGPFQTGGDRSRLYDDVPINNVKKKKINKKMFKKYTCIKYQITYKRHTCTRWSSLTKLSIYSKDNIAADVRFLSIYILYYSYW